jgi:hypothetical protein
MNGYRSRQKGQVSAEWLVGTVIILFALFVPVAGDQSAVGMLMTAIRDYYAASSFVTSMP